MCQLKLWGVLHFVLKGSLIPLLLEGVPEGRGSDLNITALQYRLFKCANLAVVTGGVSCFVLERSL